MAHELVTHLLPHSGASVRIGISGVPGVGKSTFVEALGLHLMTKGHRVAVLAVDPSSQISGGSIMGDKVRMEHLARNPASFIRPSPSAGSLGGVARKTRESMLLCEAAGYDVVLIETVGVGQSEVAVAEMVDVFLVLMLPNAGDEIQGIKKGIVEMADLLVINKADGAYRTAAQQAQRSLQNALHFIRSRRKGWTTPVLTCSALESEGIEDVWEMVQQHRNFLQEANLLDDLRADQMEAWFFSSLREEIMTRFYQDPKISAQLKTSLAEIRRNRRSPHQAAEALAQRFLASRPKESSSCS